MIATVENKLDAIRHALPSEGLFADKDWLISPDAFPISEKFASELEQLGHRLFVFQRACNQLYQLSVRGKQPGWIAQYLDTGKPAELVELSRQKIFRDALPRVIRPDLILTEKSYIIAEIDSVPGGIGLTGWLNRTYSALGQDVIGGEEGMLDGFQKVLPNGGDILVSEESATYRPEMEWLAEQLNQHRTSNLEHPMSKWRVVPAENYEPQPGRDVYRFFELFDLPNIPKIEVLLRSAAEGKLQVDAAVQTVSGGENVVRSLLAQAIAAILAARAGRQIFSEIAAGYPLHLVAGSDALAATRGDSAAGDSRLARGIQV